MVTLISSSSSTRTGDRLARSRDAALLSALGLSALQRGSLEIDDERREPGVARDYSDLSTPSLTRPSVSSTGELGGQAVPAAFATAKPWMTQGSDWPDGIC